MCNSGIPFALGPWNLTTATKSFSSSPLSKALRSSSCVSKIIAGPSIIYRSSGTAEILMTDRPRLPFNNLSPPDSLNGLSAVLTIVSSPLFLGRSVQISLPFSLLGFFVYSFKPPSLIVITSGYMHPVSMSSRITNAGPPAV